MEKEQIVKALECCEEKLLCDECPNEDEKRCVGKTMRDALFLIREQEKMIEKLTLEYEGFEADAKDARTSSNAPPSADNAFVEEIARLQNVIYSYVVQYGTVKDQREAIDRIKAEVARDIFAEIEPCHAIGDFTGDKVYYAIRVEDYNKCKKKYTEEKA